MPRNPDTAAYLAETLTAAGAPAGMVTKARDGYYHDYRSPLATPCIQLVADLTAAGLTGLADRAKQGEFDATRAEADAWARSPDGQQTFRDLLGGPDPVTPPASGRAAEPQRSMAPGVDDEATITVRLRIDSPTTRDAVAMTLIRTLPGAITDALADKLGDLLTHPAGGVTLAGVDVTLPGFEPDQLTSGPAPKE